MSRVIWSGYITPRAGISPIHGAGVGRRGAAYGGPRHAVPLPPPTGGGCVAPKLQIHREFLLRLPAPSPFVSVAFIQAGRL